MLMIGMSGCVPHPAIACPLTGDAMQWCFLHLQSPTRHSRICVLWQALWSIPELSKGDGGMVILSAAQRQHWTVHGWLLFSQSLAPEVVPALSGWVEEMAVKGIKRTQRLLYYERTAQGKSLCRVERFLDDHPHLRSLIVQGALPIIASTLLGERAVIYKEKINYKLAGGAGYAPHQDAAAYRYINHHVTCLVAVDDMTPDIGCLEFALGHQAGLIPPNEMGCIDPQVARELTWAPVPVPAGDVLFFSSKAPHRSGANRTDTPRRAIYLTYNAASEGDLRQAYYDDRARQLAEQSAANAGEETARISTIGHFLGERTA
jgi:ectoine hydroxylase-related dioxygenase (phytanoyl-CoA dioxygenase family)